MASINIGKHIDKHDDDKAKGVGTFPVRVGETVARRVDQAAIVLIYAVIAYLVFVPRYFTPVMLVVFLASGPAFKAIRLLNQPRPGRAARRAIRSGPPGSPPPASSTTGASGDG